MDGNPKKYSKVNQQTLADFASTIHDNPNLSEQEILTKFPEFEGDKNAIQSALDYISTVGENEPPKDINTKFPEFNFGGGEPSKKKEETTNAFSEPLSGKEQLENLGKQLKSGSAVSPYSPSQYTKEQKKPISLSPQIKEAVGAVKNYKKADEDWRMAKQEYNEFLPQGETLQTDVLGKPTVIAGGIGEEEKKQLGAKVETAKLAKNEAAKKVGEYAPSLTNASPEVKKIQSILEDNKDKNFVKRILDPDKFPTLDLGDGQHATHLMAWGETDGKNIVYPTVIQGEDGKLKQLGDDEAFDYALKSGEFIEFKTPKEADEFSKNYKKVWDVKTNPIADIGAELEKNPFEPLAGEKFAVPEALKKVEFVSDISDLQDKLATHGQTLEDWSNYVSKEAPKEFLDEKQQQLYKVLQTGDEKAIKTATDAYYKDIDNRISDIDAEITRQTVSPSVFNDNPTIGGDSIEELKKEKADLINKKKGFLSPDQAIKQVAEINPDFGIFDKMLSGITPAQKVKLLLDKLYYDRAEEMKKVGKPLNWGEEAAKSIIHPFNAVNTAINANDKSELTKINQAISILAPIALLNQNPDVAESKWTRFGRGFWNSVAGDAIGASLPKKEDIADKATYLIGEATALPNISKEGKSLLRSTVPTLGDQAVDMVSYIAGVAPWYAATGELLAAGKVPELIEAAFGKLGNLAPLINKIVPNLTRMTTEGLTSGITGQVMGGRAKEDLTFWGRFLGQGATDILELSPFGKYVSGALSKLGVKEIPSFVKTLAKLHRAGTGEAIGETVEELITNYQSSDSFEDFKKTLTPYVKHPSQGLLFVLGSYLFGSAAGGISPNISHKVMDEGSKAYQNLTPEDKAVVDKVMDDVQEKQMDAGVDLAMKSKDQIPNKVVDELSETYTKAADELEATKIGEDGYEVKVGDFTFKGKTEEDLANDIDNAKTLSTLYSGEQQHRTENGIEIKEEAAKEEAHKVTESEQGSVGADKVKPIRQLGGGENVYYETNKYRVNDSKGGKILLNVGNANDEVPIAHIEFETPNEAVFVAKKLEENAPHGLSVDYHNVEKIIEGYKNEFKTSTEETAQVTEPEAEKQDEGNIKTEEEYHALEEHVKEEERKNKTEYPKLSYKEEFIHRNLGKVDAQQLEEAVGSKVFKDDNMRQQFTKKDGQGLDQAAQELSETSGMDITPQDIVNYFLERTQKNGRFVKQKVANYKGAIKIAENLKSAMSSAANATEDVDMLMNKGFLEGLRSFPLSSEEVDALQNHIDKIQNDEKAREEFKAELRDAIRAEKNRSEIIGGERESQFGETEGVKDEIQKRKDDFNAKVDSLAEKLKAKLKPEGTENIQKQGIGVDDIVDFIANVVKEAHSLSIDAAEAIKTARVKLKELGVEDSLIDEAEQKYAKPEAVKEGNNPNIENDEIKGNETQTEGREGLLKEADTPLNGGIGEEMQTEAKSGGQDIQKTIDKVLNSALDIDVKKGVAPELAYDTLSNDKQKKVVDEFAKTLGSTENIVRAARDGRLMPWQRVLLYNVALQQYADTNKIQPQVDALLELKDLVQSYARGLQAMQIVYNTPASPIAIQAFVEQDIERTNKSVKELRRGEAEKVLAEMNKPITTDGEAIEKYLNDEVDEKAEKDKIKVNKAKIKPERSGSKSNPIQILNSFKKEKGTLGSAYDLLDKLSKASLLPEGTQIALNEIVKGMVDRGVTNAEKIATAINEQFKGKFNEGVEEAYNNARGFSEELDSPKEVSEAIERVRNTAKDIVDSTAKIASKQKGDIKNIIDDKINTDIESLSGAIQQKVVKEIGASLRKNPITKANAWSRMYDKMFAETSKAIDSDNTLTAQEKSDLKEFADYYLKGIFENIVTNNAAKKIINQALGKVNWNEVIGENKTVAEAKEKLNTYLNENLPDNANKEYIKEQLGRVLENEISTKRANAIQAVINRNANTKKKAKIIVDTDRLAKLVEQGALDIEDVYTVLGKQFGLTQLTPSQKTELTRLSENLHNAPKGELKIEARHEIAAFTNSIVLNKLSKFLQVVEANEVINLFSPETLGINAVGSFAEWLDTLDLESFTDATQKKEFKKAAAVFLSIMKGGQSYIEGYTEAIDKGSERGELSKEHSLNVLETPYGGRFLGLTPEVYAKILNKQIDVNLLNQAQKGVRNYARFMNAADAFFMSPIHSKAAYQIRQRQLVLQGMNQVDAAQQASQEVYFGDFEAAQKQAASELGKLGKKLEWSAVNRRAGEILMQKLPDEIQLLSEDITKEATFKGAPRGLVGNIASLGLSAVPMLIRAISPFTYVGNNTKDINTKAQMKALNNIITKWVVPFNSGVSNIAERSAELFAPYSLAKIAYNASRLGKSEIKFRDIVVQKTTSTEAEIAAMQYRNRLLLRRAERGTILIGLILYAIAKSREDDKRAGIYGNGAEDLTSAIEATNPTLKRVIRMGGRDYSFKYFPDLEPLLNAFGAMEDMRRAGKELTTPEQGAILTSAYFDTNYMQGITNLIKLAKGDTRYYQKTIANGMVNMFEPMAATSRWVQRNFVDTKMKDLRGLDEQLAYYSGVFGGWYVDNEEQNMVDMHGNEISIQSQFPNATMSNGDAEKQFNKISASYKIQLRNGVTLTQPDKGDLVIPTEEGARPYTEYEYREYVHGLWKDFGAMSDNVYAANPSEYENAPKEVLQKNALDYKTTVALANKIIMNAKLGYVPQDMIVEYNKDTNIQYLSQATKDKIATITGTPVAEPVKLEYNLGGTNYKYKQK